MAPFSNTLCCSTCVTPPNLYLMRSISTSTVDLLVNWTNCFGPRGQKLSGWLCHSVSIFFKSSMVNPLSYSRINFLLLLVCFFWAKIALICSIPKSGTQPLCACVCVFVCVCVSVSHYMAAAEYPWDLHGLAFGHKYTWRQWGVILAISHVCIPVGISFLIKVHTFRTGLPWIWFL